MIVPTIAPWVINIPRQLAEQRTTIPGSAIWISITDPGTPPVSSPLSLLKHLRLSFDRPTPTHAAAIVEFLMEHPQANVVVNCTAGRVRSAAVAAFCEALGRTWKGIGKAFGKPDEELFALLTQYHQGVYTGDVVKR